MAAVMDWEIARQILFAVTGDLKPSQTTTSTDLLAARKDVAIAISMNQDPGSFGIRNPYKNGNISLPPLQWPQYDDAKPTSPLPKAQAATRKITGFQLPTNFDSSGENYVGLKPAVIHGPFLDHFDRSVYIEVFKPIIVTDFAFPGQGPYIHVAAPIHPIHPFESTLGPGFIWIKASLFTPSNRPLLDISDDSYLGLRIVSGSMTVPPTSLVARRLNLKLDGSVTTSAAFSIKPVTDVSLNFIAQAGNTTKAIVSSLGGGQAVLFGSTFDLQKNLNSVTFDNNTNRLNFAMSTNSSIFTPLQNVSSLIDVTGKYQVPTIAWSVAMKTFSQNLFYEPTASGDILISLEPETKLFMKEEAINFTLQDGAALISQDSLLLKGRALPTALHSSTVALGRSDPDSKPSKSSFLTFRPGNFLPLYFEAKFDGTECFTIHVDLKISMQEPTTVNNECVPFESITWINPELINTWNTISWLRSPQSTDLSLHVQASSTLPQVIVTYALKNLMLKADRPASIELAGKYQKGLLSEGAARTTSFLRYTLPFLPDPFLSNFELTIDAVAEKSGLGYMTATTRWNGATLSNLEVTMLAELFTATPTIERLGGETQFEDLVLSQIAHGNLQYWDPNFHVKERAYGLIPDTGLGSTYHYPDRRGGLSHPPTLLDISSNSSQFGVVFGTKKPLSELSTTQNFQISDLMLVSTPGNVRIMALPAVQWEPIREANADSIPATLGQTYRFPYSGPSVQVSISDTFDTDNSVGLVPVAPKEAIENMIESYNSLQPVTIASRFSLPSGMVSLTVLPKILATIHPRVGKIDSLAGDDEDPTTGQRPEPLHPSDQLSFRPSRPLSLLTPLISGQPRKLVGKSDPSFAGMTTTLQMNVRQDPDGKSDIIDPATTQFGLDMAEIVPLTRFDLSGYGASIFSDWRRVLGPDVEVGITKVLLDVINGRSLREVVNLESVMAPFGVTVIKTIEVKRLNNGLIVRHESNWEPTSDGRYFYKNPDIVTHIGVIHGVVDVRNVRETSGSFIVPDTQVEVVKVVFDCSVEVEDTNKTRLVPAKDLKGCVFSKSTDLKGTDGVKRYTQVLQTLDLGGPVDLTVQIGNSGQMKRITSISVISGIDPATQQQVSVASAWGSPIFPGGGQWSFAKTIAGLQPQAVDMLKGVPLVREGRHDLANLASRVTPYLFRDPSDLLSQTPATVYSIIHGAGSHRVMFSAPQIPNVQDLQKGILADNVLVADSLALGKSTGIFPNLADCIPVSTGLPADSKQLLQVIEGGGYAFEPKQLLNGVVQGAELELLDQARILTDDASVKTVVQTINSGTDDVKSTLSLAINTAKNISKMDITNINLVTSTVSSTTTEASRVIGRLSSDISKVEGLLGRDTGLPDLDPNKLLESPLHKFGPALAQVQKVVSFLESLKFLPSFKVSMTNEWAMIMSTSMNRDDLMKKIPEPSRPPVERIIESFEFGLSSRTSLSSFLLKMHVGASIKIPTGFPPVVAIGKGAFDVALGTAGIEIKLDLGFGIGVDFSLGPFGVSASYTQSQTILFSEDHWGIGITACMRAHIDLVIASADLYLEAKLLVVGGECDEHVAKRHDHTTIWAFAQVRIAVHVSVFLICNISVDKEAQWENNFNHGPCLLDHMSDLVH